MLYRLPWRLRVNVPYRRCRYKIDDCLFTLRACVPEAGGRIPCHFRIACDLEPMAAVYRFDYNRVD